MPEEWNLHYEGWIIEDGNPHRAVGETFDWFTLEFWSENPLKPADKEQKLAVPVDDFRYRVVAEVIFVSRTACVIDFGLRAIASPDRLPAESKPGDMVAGEIVVGIPLCTPLVPDEVLATVRRTWYVNAISADITPYIPLPDKPRCFVRDISRIAYQPVEATHSLQAETYILHCFPAPPILPRT